MLLREGADPEVVFSLTHVDSEQWTHGSNKSQQGWNSWRSHGSAQGSQESTSPNGILQNISNNIPICCCYTSQRTMTQVMLLVEAGADAGAIDEDGNNSLHIATR